MLGLKSRVLDPPLIISTHNSNQMLINKQVGPLMKVWNKLLVWDFDLYHPVRIDVILGLDRLSKNHAIIDCNRKKVYSA